MTHKWQHPSHYKQVSKKRKKIHEEWLRDQEEKLRQNDAGQNDAGQNDPKGATKSRKLQAG